MKIFDVVIMVEIEERCVFLIIVFGLSFVSNTKKDYIYRLVFIRGFIGYRF